MIRVLLIDDEEDALNLIEILLGKIGGMQVVGKFVNPVRAIEFLNTTPVDAVFLDNQMPGMIGTEAARKIRETKPHMPIVFTTAYAEYAVEAFEIQSTDYLLKPITLNRLQHTASRIKQAVSIFQTPLGTSANTFIQCMGGFSIGLPHAANQPLSWKTNKEKEVCAFLIHHEGKPVDTALIIESIWPGYDLQKAKTYLYTCLSYLRRNLLENDIPMRVNKAGNGFAVALDGLSADVALLNRMLDNALSAEEPDERLYDRINVLYKGEYLENCGYSWAFARQAEIKVKYIRALRRMYRLFRTSGHAALAEDSLQRVLTIAPESETDGRELIRLNMELGNRNEALRVYRRLEQVVREQLGVALEEETVRLHQQMGWHE